MHNGLIDSYTLQKQYREYLAAADNAAFDIGDWLPELKGQVRPLVPGELVVLLGDTGVGKTAILQNIAVSIPRHLTVAFFELELPGSLTFERFMAIATGYTQEGVEQAYKEEQIMRVVDIDHIHVCDRSGLSLDDIGERIETFERENGKIDVVFVDYIGLVGGGKGSRYERLSNVAEGLKVLAKNTNTVVVAATQIHRKGDDYPDEVYIHDAKDSGSIENSAGLMLGIWRDKEEPTRFMHLKILKNTKGRVGAKVELECDWPTMRIRQRTHLESIETYGEGLT